ncbi:hypothetical protein FRC02_001520 [Tulasnella sp. 418]|nr:hypothetical protein FRC02_001520 [Tulasnella sp. 418]
MNDVEGRDLRRISLELPAASTAIELYGAPPSSISRSPAKQMACLNKQCYPIDAVQAYLRAAKDRLDEHYSYGP